MPADLAGPGVMGIIGGLENENSYTIKVKAPADLSFKAGVIIADTSGLVSLFSPDDRNHVEALNAAKRLQHENKDILIPAAVFVEFLNVMGRKAGHAVALAAVTD